MTSRNTHIPGIRKRLLAPKVLFLLVAAIAFSWGQDPFMQPAAALGSPQQATSSLIINLFEDQNVNSAFDAGEPGVAGIVVNVYGASDASGSPCVTKTTSGSGELIFSPAETASCAGERLRFEVDSSTYPAGTVVGPVNQNDDDGNPATASYADAASDAGPATQIVDLTSEVEANISVVDPTSYTCSPENAYAMTTCFVNGNSQPADSPSHNMDALVGFPYLASGSAFPGTAMDYLEPDHLATMGEIGSAWGLAWSQQTEQVYVGALLKRHVALGPLGLGGLYRVDFSTGTAATEEWLNVEDGLGIPIGQSLVPDAATRNLPTDLEGPSYDSETYPLIATVGLGDVDLVTDEGIDPAGVNADGWIDREFLFVVDLFNKDVLVIDTTDQSLVMTYNIPAPTPACTNGTHRPWAVDYVDGKMFVGIVCDGSAESAAVKDSLDVNPNLEAIVYEYDLTADLGAATIPAAPTVAPQTVLRIGLDYEKGAVHGNICPAQSNWHPWRDDAPPRVSAQSNALCWPMPLLVDIEFTDGGDMMLAFMDRSTHQLGWVNYSPDTTDANTYKNMSGGDILMACLDNSGAYVLESDGSCGQLTSANPLTQNEGPGGREFFYGDSWPSEDSTGHLETANNGIAVLPGSNEVIAAGMDPYGNAYHGAGGINWYSTVDGTPRDPGYMLYASLTSNSPVDLIGTFGKSGGLGDVDLICPQMPITIGDYVWFDSDNDGIQDPDETPLAGVTVYLELPNGTLISTVTDESGRYYFEASRNQSYLIAFDASTSTTTLPNGLSPAALVPTASNSTGSNNENDSDLDATLTVSGVELPALTLNTDKGGSSDHSHDGGFIVPSYDLALIKTLAPGQASEVYPSATVDYVVTVKNQGEVSSGDFIVTEQIPAGMSYVTASGTDWTCSEPSGRTVTCTFSGNLQSQESTELNLSLRLDHATQGPFRNWSEISEDSSDDYNSDDVDSTPDPNTGDDDGPGTGTPPNDPVANTDDIDYAGEDDEDDNDYADLFAAPFVSIGDTVWHDANDDGILNSGNESGIGGVAVELLDADGAVIDSTTTDENGYYRFDDLLPGEYQVRIPQPPVEYPLSSTTTDSADNREDNDDNGEQSGGYGAFVISPMIDLQPDAEPTNDGDDDSNSDLTVDFGFWAPSAEIELQKTVYRGHNGGSSCPGVEQETGVQGDLVTYCFVVTNTGNVHLNEIELTDPDLGIERSDMTLLSGSEPLAPNASMTFYYETSMNGTLLNTASTSGNPTDPSGNDIPNLPNPEDEDDAEVLQFAPAIRLDKTVYFGQNGGADCPGRELVTGVSNDLLTYCFLVTNTGDTYLSGITISDPDLAIDRSNMTLIGGSEPLAPGATLSFYYEGTLTADLVNTANTAGNPTDENGNDIPNLPDPTDEDDAEVQLFAPAIQLEKTVFFGHSNGAGCPGSELVTGVQSDAVTYCFVVTNTGDTYLDEITLTDPDLDADRSDMTLLSGSEPLAPGATITFYFEDSMAGNLINTASTSGNPTDENGEDIPNLEDPTDDDDAEVQQFGPGIRLNKTVYPGHDGGVGCPGEELVFGVQNSPVTYCFVVTNTGDSYLNSITLDDPDLSIDRSNMTLLSGSEPLAPGASMTFYYNGAITQDLINEANTSGNPTDENGNDIPNLPIVRDDNDAQVELTAPAIELDKTVYSGHNNGADCPGTDLETGVAGTLVTYCFVVTNSGDTYLGNIMLTDPALGIVRSDMTLISGAEPLAPGDSMTFFYNGEITADLINTAGVVGNPTDEDGNDIPNLPEVSDLDDAEVQLYAPGISLDKTVYFGHNGGADCPGGELTTGVNGDPVTYCFVVTNTGDTHLNAITLVDSDLGIDRSNMTFLSGSEPVAPGAQLIFFYETELLRDLVNIAETSGNPTDENGNDIPNVPDPTDSDDAEVEKFAPSISLRKTVYPGHNSGTYCPGGELVNGVQGSRVTYCFVVTNTGDTYLNEVTLSDPTLGITREDMTILRGAEPLAPGDSLIFYYDGLITGDVVNVASTTANPTDENGTDIPNLDDVDDEDQAEVQLHAPGIDLQKTVYIGHDGGVNCPGEEIVTGYGQTDVTYCFVVTNTGDTHLDAIDIVDQTLNITHEDLTLLSGVQPLAPGAQMVYYYETVRAAMLLNRAIVVANPTDENGNDIPNLPYQLAQDTASVVVSPVAGIGDTVWLDTNADGIQDPDEIGLADVTVVLYDIDGIAIATTTTDQQGNYLFGNLVPGTYSVGFELPSELHLFSPMDNTAAGDAADSDADPSTGLTIQTELLPGEIDLTWDAGIFTPPILIIDKKPNLSIVQPSGTIIYAVEYENVGLGLATGIVIEEIIPAYTQFVPELSSPGWRCSESVSGPATCQFEIASLAGMESGRLDLSFAVQADSVLPEGVTRVVNTITIKDDGTHGVLPSSQSTQTKIVNVVRPTSLDSEEEPISYESLFDIEFEAGGANTQRQTFLPIISRRQFKGFTQGPISMELFWTLQGCNFFIEALNGQPELLQSPNIPEWLSYCDAVLGGSGE